MIQQTDFITKKAYDNSTQELLTLSQYTHEFQSTEWMSYSQARAVGRKPRKGAVATSIFKDGQVIKVFNKDQTGIVRK